MTWLKDTIVHELLHTVPGAYNHQEKWKALAQLVNTNLPGYNIKRTASYDEKGIEAVPRQRNYRYVVRYEKCGYTIYRERKSKLVQNPEHYRCALCGGQMFPILKDTTPKTTLTIHEITFYGANPNETPSILRI